jgi:predicted ATP-grasp superfamily ATP-dependent carboligase
MSGENLMILGASARAAAFSALRAGLRPWCADLFADRDLQARCPVLCLPGRYPESFAGLIDTELTGPWMYTGGLENWPDLVRRLARRRPLWGNDEKSLRLARDPLFVRRVLHAAGLEVPAVHRQAAALPLVFRWLWKPCRSAGGSGIRFLTPWETRSAARGPGYYQEFIEGEPCAALYVGDGRQAWLLGLTRQLVGVPWLHAAPFHYCGSLGPLELTDPLLRESLVRMGGVLAQRCGLRGLFGVDGVLREGVFWPVEVNPRYTASVEVVEHATGTRALAWHGLVFTLGGLPAPFPPLAPLRECIGKAIHFARADLVFPPDGPWLAGLRSPTPLDDLPLFADIPAPETPIRAGKPVLTFFARGNSVAACEEALREMAADLDRRLYGG